MRYVYSAAAVMVATLAPSLAFGQGSNLSVVSYIFTGTYTDTVQGVYTTYQAVLQNTGPALAGVTATVTSLNTGSVQTVAGQSTVHFSPVPANGQVTSSDTFTILVNRSETFSFSFLQWSFQSPFADPGPNQTAPVGQVVTLNGSASTNPAGGQLTYGWAFVTPNGIPAGSNASLSNANTAVASFTVDKVGQYLIQLTVSNGSASDTATVAVSTLNTPPVANAGANQTVTVGSTVNLNGSGSTDIDGYPLTYQWSFVSKPPGSATSLNDPRSVFSSFLVDVAGTYIVQLVVNDGNFNSQPSTVTITTGNVPPVANAGPNQSGVTPGSLVQLNGSGSTDVAGNPLSYLWSFNSVPPNSSATLSNPNAVRPTFTADKVGTYIVQLTVTDTVTNLSNSATVTITTSSYQAPTANAGQNQTVALDSVVTLNGSGTDPQSFPLTYSWSLITLPAGSQATLSATNIADPTFVADVTGNFVAQLIVNNGYLSSMPSTVNIATTPTPPTANAGPNQNVYLGSTVTLEGSGLDPNSLNITYSWSLITKPAGSSATLSGANTANPTFVADVSGTYVAQLIVSDKYTSSAPATVTITAGELIITLSPSELDLYNTPGTMTVTLSPPAGPSPVTVNLRYYNDFISGPPTVVVPANSSGANFSITPLSLGLSEVTANASQYQPAGAWVSVSTSSIQLGFNGLASVGWGQSTGGTITLNTPAPSTGATVTLSASGAGQESFSNNGVVTIPSGSATGTFTVTGTGVGATTVTASAAGYTSGTASLQVALATISFSTQAVSVGAGGVQSINLLLSAPAPAGGLPISLNSSNTNAATVPSSVPIAQNSSSASFNVTGVSASAGGANITASTTNPNFSAAGQTLAVTVTNGPSISGLNPPSATAGGSAFTLTISGSGFTSGATVNWSGQAALTTLTQTPSQLTVAVPQSYIATAGPATVTVTDPSGGGTSSGATFTINNPAPTVSGISPASANVGTGPITITVSGSNFVSGATVNFGTVATGLATNVITSSSLTVVIPTTDLTTAGTENVTVTNPGSSASTGTNNFTINNLAPTVSGISPASANVGAGPITITVSGSNFESGVTTVNFGTVQSGVATNVTSSTTLTVTIPATDLTTAGTENVTVTNPLPGGGTSSGTNNFTINNLAPTVTGIGPTSANVGTGPITITVSGTNFEPNVTTVTFGTIQSGIATNVTSSTSLMVTIPATDLTTAGTENVTVTNPLPGGGTSTGTNTFTISNPAPTVGTLSPPSGTTQKPRM